MRSLTLRTRLLLSYVVVIVAGAAVILLVTDLLARLLFDHRTSGPGLGSGGAHRAAVLHAVFSTALTQSLLVAAGASLVVAFVAAFVVAGRILRPIEDIRAATRRMVSGEFGTLVPPPLEPELAALVTDVNSLSAALRESDRRRAALIGDVAHELRTPLASARGYVEGLVDGIFTSEETAAALLQELSRLERLAGDLGEVSRAEEGVFELHIGEEDLAEIARSVVSLLQPGFFAKGVQLDLDVEGSVRVRGDHDRLIQATTNLVRNALEYTPAGGAVRVRVLDDPRPVLVVADSGVGLTADQLEHVFERFYRVSAAEHAGGTGIGLTIARSIARAHGGDVEAASEGRDRGSTFTLSLPRPR